MTYDSWKTTEPEVIDNTADEVLTVMDAILGQACSETREDIVGEIDYEEITIDLMDDHAEAGFDLRIRGIDIGNDKREAAAALHDLFANLAAKFGQFSKGR